MRVATARRGDAEATPAAGPAAAGRAVIQAALAGLPSGPGVYRMTAAGGDVLYVGKARNLRKRVASYASPGRLSTRLHRMVAQVVALDVVTTHTEVEALLLEANLIKRLKPRYNILLRDDKSFPCIVLRRDHPWPQLAKHRGARDPRNEYFGPFASAGAVNQTLNALQRAFPLRSCSDAVFANRSRPCLQYQIKRCTAPCVGRIDAGAYAAIVAETRAFLAGKSREVQARMDAAMQASSEALEFETAAVYRDRIRALTQVQMRQDVNVSGLGEADLVALHQEAGQSCVEVFFFRAGHNYGNRAYFPVHTGHPEPAEVMAAFLGQFYRDREAPRLLLVSDEPAERALLEEALSGARRRVRIAVPRRGVRYKLVANALANARLALARRLSEGAAQRRLLEGLAARLGLEGPPRRIEVFDNSHLGGTEPMASMIVAGAEGFRKAAYRKFAIRREVGGAPGDDYAMMREVLTRRFARLIKEETPREDWPDLVLLDGGLGQLNVALEVFAELGVGGVALAGIAKGPERDAGRERIHLPGRPPLVLDGRDSVLFFLQRLRDEAHRFAIGSHRARRRKTARGSPLDQIPGIGATRKRALLHHFGSARGVAQAGLADLEAVGGISKRMAQAVYDHFHPAT